MSSHIRIILLPDNFEDPVQILPFDNSSESEEPATRYAHMLRIRTGEDMTSDPQIRRYEFGAPAGAHLSDLVNNRVVIRDSATANSIQLPTWARNVTALHPERRDVSKWFDAASKDPDAPWVNHLALIIRDALRNEAQDLTGCLVLPDRAYVTALAHEGHPSLDALNSAFATPAFEIDQRAQRTDAMLPTLAVSVRSDPGPQFGLITRAQAIVSHQLCHALGQPSTPAQHDILERWAMIVHDDHQNRLMPGKRNQFLCPLAILDDHGGGDQTATLTLATLAISFDDGRPDVCVRYQLSFPFDASRPFSYDIITALDQADAHGSHYDRYALQQAVQEDALPILEIAARNSGSTGYRSLSHTITSAEQLFRDDTPVNLTDAVTAYLNMRSLVGMWSQDDASSGGSPTQQDDQIDIEVARIDAPPEPTSMDDTPSDLVGSSGVQVPNDDEQSSLLNEADATTSDLDDTTAQTEDGTETEDDSGSGSGAGDTNVEDGHLVARTDDETAASDSQDSQDSQGDTDLGQLQLRPEPTATHQGDDKTVADEVRAAIAGESDLTGDSNDDMGDETDKNAHAAQPPVTLASSDGALQDHEGNLIGDSTLDDLLAAITDTDKAIISDIRDKVRTKKRKGVTSVPPDDAFRAELRTRQQFYAKALSHIYRNHLKIGDPAVADLALCLRSPKAWVRLLFLLNLSKALIGEKETMHSVTKSRSKDAAAKVIKQTSAVGLAVPAMPSAVVPKAEGGLNG